MPSTPSTQDATEARPGPQSFLPEQHAGTLPGGQCCTKEAPKLGLREGFPEEVARGLGLQLAWQSMF